MVFSSECDAAASSSSSSSSSTVSSTTTTITMTMMANDNRNHNHKNEDRNDSTGCSHDSAGAVANETMMMSQPQQQDEEDERCAITAAAAAKNNNNNNKKKKKGGTSLPTWEEMYRELITYRETFGTVRVPAVYTPNKRLGKWVSRQRLAQKTGELKETRKSKLEEIGFCWDVQAWNGEQRWQERWEALKALYEQQQQQQQQQSQSQQGQPSSVELQSRDLATWCSRQRQQYKLGHLRADRKAQLDSIGFPFQIVPPESEEEQQTRFQREEMQWMERYHQLKSLLLLASSSSSSSSWQRQSKDLWLNDASSSSWLAQQRKQFAEGTLLDHRKTLLEDLGTDFFHSKSFLFFSSSSSSSSSASILEEQWKEKWKRLKEYQANHGTLEVPSTDTEHVELYRWIRRQRTLHRLGNIDVTRQERLEQIGFEFKVPEEAEPVTHDESWESKFHLLVEFQNKWGHIQVRSSHKDDLQLYRWVRQQRKLYKEQRLDSQRRERLEGLGLTWEPERKQQQQTISDSNNNKKDSSSSSNNNKKKNPSKKNSRFEENLKRLQEYKEKTGHTNVPRNYKLDPALAHFVANQRKQWKMGKMVKERKAQLDTIGFAFHIKEQRSWEDNFVRLKAFKKAKGHCNVPCRWSEDCALGSFVNFQRRKYRENKLPRDRKEQLLSIGFEFDVLPSGAQKRKAERPTVKSVKEARVTPFNEKRWNGMYAALTEYKKDHGHANVPLRDKNHPKLGKWVSHQRIGCVRQDRRHKLDAVGFVWDASTLTSKKRELGDEEKTQVNTNRKVQETTKAILKRKAKESSKSTRMSIRKRQKRV